MLAGLDLSNLATFGPVRPQAPVVGLRYFGKLFGGFAPLVANNILAKLGFPLPLAWAYWLGFLELVGGAMLAIGLLTRPIALLLVIEFIVITFFWNFRFGFSFTAQGGGFEYPLVLLVLYVAIFFKGGGRYSLDRFIGREL